MSQAPEGWFLGCVERWGGLEQRYETQLVLSAYNELRRLRLKRKNYTFERPARVFFTGAIGFTGIESGRFGMAPFVLGCFGS